MSDIITKPEFDKIDMRVGEIVGAEPIASAENFMRITLDDGSDALRQIVTDTVPLIWIGIRVVFVANLPVVTVHGFESHGSILSVSDGEYRWFVTPDDADTKPGTRVT